MEWRGLVNNFRAQEMFFHWVNRRGICSAGLCSEECTDQTVATLWLNPKQTWKCGGGSTPLNESSLISASPTVLVGHLLCEGSAEKSKATLQVMAKAFFTDCNCGMRKSWGFGDQEHWRSVREAEGSVAPSPGPNWARCWGSRSCCLAKLTFVAAILNCPCPRTTNALCCWQDWTAPWR